MFDLEILDKILLILNKEENKRVTQHEINIHLRQDILISIYITNFIIQKNLERLIQDNYIKEVTEDIHIEDFGTHPITYFLLTSHGYTFIKESGYVRTYYYKLSLEEENRILRKSQIELNKATLWINRWMFWLTAIIAAGSVASFVYYVIEIYSFFHLCKK